MPKFKEIEMSSFYLVQRMVSKESPSAAQVGIDRWFSLEYMGSSEFEWGAVPKALARVRAAVVTVFERDFALGGITRPVFFVVAGENSADEAAHAMTRWSLGGAQDHPFRGKEQTHFPEAFSDNSPSYYRTDAWFDLESGAMWALDQAVADKLAAGINKTDLEAAS